MSDDRMTTFLELIARLPPMEYDEEQLPDGTVLLHLRDPGPPYAGGGTLVLPAGTVFTGRPWSPQV